MSNEVYIYSTLTCSNIFAIYRPKDDPKQLSQIVKRIEILGGHGLKNPKGIDTPRGVVTKISAEDYAFLKNDRGFQDQMKAGFLSVDEKNVDPEKKIKDMNLRDGSSPLVPEDFEISETSTKDKPIYKDKKSKKGE